MDLADDRIAIVILAGGESTRLPGKLEIDAGGMPLIVRVYRNLAGAGPVYLSVSAHRAFSPEIEAALPCPKVTDRMPRRGPLGGLLSTFEQIAQSRAFVVAGDAPFVDASIAQELQDAWEPGIAAVIPVNAQGYLEPLCALYDRAAFLAAAARVYGSGSGGVAAVVEHLATKRVRISNERAFANVNTSSDRRLIL